MTTPGELRSRHRIHASPDVVHKRSMYDRGRDQDRDMDLHIGIMNNHLDTVSARQPDVGIRDRRQRDLLRRAAETPLPDDEPDDDSAQRPYVKRKRTSIPSYAAKRCGLRNRSRARDRHYDATATTDVTDVTDTPDATVAVVQLCIAMTSLLTLGIMMVFFERFV